MADNNVNRNLEFGNAYSVKALKASYKKITDASVLDAQTGEIKKRIQFGEAVLDENGHPKRNKYGHIVGIINVTLSSDLQADAKVTVEDFVRNENGQYQVVELIDHDNFETDSDGNFILNDAGQKVPRVFYRGCIAGRYRNIGNGKDLTDLA